MNCFAAFLNIAILTLDCVVAASVSTTLPIVDLGYELHQAIAYNDTGAYYNFSNIRYAAPPLGNLRFSPPQQPTTNRNTTQTGNRAVICPQTTPAWLQFAEPWIYQYLAGAPITLTQAQLDAANASQTLATVIPQDATASEDCLFLDVVVPKNVFNKEGSTKSKGAPVMVWIHGGGFMIGSKTFYGNPAGIIERSKTQGREGVIFVSINYR